MFVWFLYNPSAWASGWDFCFGSAQNRGGFCFKPCFQPSSPILPSLQDQRHCAAVAAAGCPSIFLTFTVSLTKQIARDTESLNFTFTENISMLLEVSDPQNAEWDAGGSQWSRSRAMGSEAPGERSTIKMQCCPSRTHQGESG